MKFKLFELFAILLALEWVEQVKPMHTCILSDCLIALQAISEPTPENKLVCDILHSIQNQANMVIFEWIPGHCGIKGNEEADKRAQMATHKNNIDVNIT